MIARHSPRVAAIDRIETTRDARATNRSAVLCFQPVRSRSGQRPHVIGAAENFAPGSQFFRSRSQMGITLASRRAPRAFPSPYQESTLARPPNYKQEKKRREEMQKKRNEEKRREQAARKENPPTVQKP
jgi:hypothetical protein